MLTASRGAGSARRNAPEPVNRIVIIGAGQAGGWAAKTLRAEGFAGDVVLIGEERHPPHERPPLSKAVMAGAAAPESTHLFKDPDFAALGLQFLAGERAAALDRAARRVLLASGRSVAYDRLLVATGSRPRRLAIPGADLPGIHYLRTIDDSLAIRDRLRTGARLLLVGGGWIGLEIAATARGRGTEVVVLEAAERLCGRAAPPEVSQYLLWLHRTHGVEVRLETAAAEFRASADGGIIARLTNGEEMTADSVVMGIGILPNVEIAASAGLAVENGIVVDDQGRTSDPDIFAAGDVTNHPNGVLGRRIRLESWQNAQNQAIAVARAMLGRDVHYNELPWFWSDQYDLNLQIAGMPPSWPRGVLRGEMKMGSFCLFFLEGERIVSVIAANAAKDLRVARRLIESGKAVRAEDLADPKVALQKL